MDYDLTNVKLLVGSGGRTQCPACKGGRSGELSCNVFQDQNTGNWLSKCHRAGCPKPLHVLEGMIEWEPQVVLRDRSYKGPILALPSGVFGWCQQQWPSISNATLASIKYNPDNNTLLLPIRPVSGKSQGWVEKAASPNWKDCPLAKPSELGWPNKVKNYYNDPEQTQLLSWYQSPQSLAAVLVEDQLSAMAVADSREYTGVALLGTGINQNKVSQLQQGGIRDIIIALDADATTQAFSMASRWGMAFDSVKVSILPKDFKDFTPDELTDWRF